MRGSLGVGQHLALRRHEAGRRGRAAHVDAQDRLTTHPTLRSPLLLSPMGRGRVRGFQLSEMAEMDPPRPDSLAHRRIRQPSELDLTLAAVAAVFQVLIEVARMGHELRDAVRQRGEMSQEPLARPVGVGARLPEEMLGGSEPALTGRPARFLILAADGNPELLGQGEHDIPDRPMAADVMVAVEMGRLPAEESNEHGHLGAQFEHYLFRLGLRGLPERIADELPAGAEQRGNLLGGRDRLAERQGQMEPDAEPGRLQAVEHGPAQPRVRYQRGAGDDPPPVGLENPPTHAGRQAEVIGVDDQPPHAGLVPCTTKRSTVFGSPVRGSAPSASRLRMWSRRSYPIRGKAWISRPTMRGVNPAASSLDIAAFWPRKAKTVKTSRPPGARGRGAPWIPRSRISQ